MSKRSDSSPQRSFAFGPFVLVPEQQLLMKGEAPVRIGTRALEMLLALIERPGELVSKDELISRAWPDTFVEQGNLKVNIAALRRSLGDRREGARYISTVNGRGYRFVAPVRMLESGSGKGQSDASSLHNLPTTTTRLIGRDSDIDAILRQFKDSRLVTLVGAGGIGKTTIASAVAARAVGQMEHGVWLVELASLSDPALVPGAIATALGLIVHSGNIEAALRAFLRERHLMLVLDNCEHLVDAVASLTERLLAEAVGMHVLATSRESLRSANEHMYRVLPLETPPLAPGMGAAELLAFPAVELFVQRAAASYSGFSLEDADAPAVADICRGLDGIPLALEISAAHVGAFTVHEILSLLDGRLRLLKGRRTAPERHQTLTATLDWSYDLLSDTERTLLRRLSVFAGSFSLETACAVAAGQNLSPSGMIADLANLVAKSLLAAEAKGPETHYRLLDTTRRYALQKLSDNAELEGLRRRHAEILSDLAMKAEVEWETRPTSEWLATYGPKVDDIRTALSWTFSEGGDTRIGMALTVAAIPFWEHLSLVEECRVGTERALQAVEGELCGDREEMKLRMALGSALLHTQGPSQEVKLLWTRVLHLAEQIGDTEYQLRSLWGLCDYHTWTGDHRAAFEITHRLRAHAIDNSDISAGINVDRQTGTALRYLGDLTEARHHLERMIAKYVPPLARSGIAKFQLDPRLAASGTLANVLWLQGYPDQAVRMAQSQLEGARAVDHALALCNALVHSICPIALFVGNLTIAEQLLAEIEDHVAKHGMTVWDAMGRCMRGEWRLRCGDKAGIFELSQALDDLSEIGFRMRRAIYLGVLAEGLAAHGEIHSAQTRIDEAIACCASSSEAWCMPELLRIKGDMLCRAGSAKSLRAAEELYLGALDQARVQGALSWELRIGISLAEMQCRRGDEMQAERLLSSIYDRFEEGHGTYDLQKAHSLLEKMRRNLNSAVDSSDTSRANNVVILAHLSHGGS